MRTRGIFVIATFFYSLLSLITYAQDTIIKINGEEILAKVIKITPEIVEYYKFNKTDGPLYSVFIADIDMIKYPDGSQDIFNKTASGNLNISSKGIESDKLIDQRDGNEYKTVKIDDQWWMAENLQYITRGSICYDNDTTNCKECGQYYEFEEALSACPEGWHLPSDEEWIKLEIYFGMLSVEAQKTGWRGSAGGQASSLIVGGNSSLDLKFCGKYSIVNSHFSGFNDSGYFWTSTTKNNEYAWARHFKLRKSIDRSTYPGRYRFSVRCIKDNE